MKPSAILAILAMGATAMLGVGCQAADGDDELADELLDDEETQVDEQQLSPVPLCQDLVVDIVTIKFCDFQTGPYDTSPITVQCHQTCVTERHLGFKPPTPGNPGGLTCVSGETDCGAVVCPSCD